MINLETFDLRTLQIECAKAMTTISGNNNALSKYNKLARHNSQLWYKAVIEDYILKWGGLPSETGPAKAVRLVLDV
jgi:hypothetical protein